MVGLGLVMVGLCVVDFEKVVLLVVSGMVF